jgi:GTP-binding protein EngB required for normal cell division
MSLITSFIAEYKEKFFQEKSVYADGFLGEIQKIRTRLLDEKFHPSIQLKSVLDKQLRRIKYPIEIAIVGQFSAGKSTFLNALLSKDILPTGITPVTSKVIFINYGEAYKLKITYYSGAQEYAPIESISNFSDQRKEELSSIKYLTLYAPVEMLKDISFVDTPGLNSQSKSDTEVTRKVLRDVGGIIWLTLIDNAGKLSELDVLDEFMESFQSKSLCLLNQKDKFEDEQVETTLHYVEEKFSKYFAKIIPISSKMALESRASHKDILLEQNYQEIIQDFAAKLKKENPESLSFFKEDFLSYRQAVQKISERDTSNISQMFKDSNMQEVLTFIDENIRAQAKDAKRFAIKKDLKDICNILISEYEIIVGVYDTLITVIKKASIETQSSFEAIYTTYSKELELVFLSLEKVLESISHEIYQNIHTKKSFRYEKKEGFLHKESYKKIDSTIYWVDGDSACNKLLYDERLVDKMLHHAINELKHTRQSVSDALMEVYETFARGVKNWQNPYEHLKKKREIASDIEYSNTRHYAAKIYENILSPYHDAILNTTAVLRQKFTYFNGALSYAYPQIIQATIAHFEQEISHANTLHHSDPGNFPLYRPTEDEILAKLKANFDFEKIENFLISKRNHLFKTIQYSKETHEEIDKKQIEKILVQKEIYLSKIEALQTIISTNEANSKDKRLKNDS